MNDPGSFQTAASVLGLRVSEFLCTPYKTEGAVSYSPLALLDVSPAVYQSQRYGGSSSPCSYPRLGSPLWGLELPLLRGCDIPPTCGFQCWGVCPSQIMCPPLLPVSVWLFLFIFSCGKSFLLVFGSFSEIVSLCVVVIFVCPWEETSPGSSYSTILSHGSSLQSFYSQNGMLLESFWSTPMALYLQYQSKLDSFQNGQSNWLQLFKAFPVIENSVFGHRSARFFSKRPYSKYFWLQRPHRSLLQLLSSPIIVWKQSEIICNMNGHGCVPIIVFMVTTIWIFIMFTFHQKESSDFFFQPFRNVKTTLSLRLAKYKNRWGTRFGPQDIFCWPLLQASH